MNWKKLGVYSILLLLIVIPIITGVMAQTPAANPTAAQANSFESWLGTDDPNSVYSLYIAPYLVPGGMSGIAGIAIGIITMVILFAIFLDVITLVAPFSEWVDWIIAVGLAIVAIMFKLSVTVAAWIVSIGATIFAWAGALAVFLTVIMSILALIAIFFGGNYLMRWVVNAKLRRRQIQKATDAIDRGQDVDSAVKQAKAMLGKKTKV